MQKQIVISAFKQTATIAGFYAISAIAAIMAFYACWFLVFGALNLYFHGA